MRSEKSYYIQLFSPHGLVRFQNPEIGRDTDTGGQVKYVLELLEALSKDDRVRKVDLFTRQIKDKRVSPAYAEPIEIVNEKARIVRVHCGGNIYRKKESLWNYLEEFVDHTIRFNKSEDDIPDLVHGHYADGNHIARQLSAYFKIPFFSTAHSLGRNKRNILLQEGLTDKVIDTKFNMSKRIREEEGSIRSANVVITSTAYEIESQYKEYESSDNAHFKVIAPGINDTLFYPFYRQTMPSFQLSIEQEQAVYRVRGQIDRFLFDPEKPLILSIGRPDKRKNFEKIIEAYGKDKELQAMANLAIFAGVRQDISKMADEEREILTNLLLLMDKYDLYGKLAIPKRNDPTLEIPEIYRLAARKKGVFINATPGENFGLTIIEAAACGLPVIASPTGGPKEIIQQCDNGILVNVDDNEKITTAAKKIIGDSHQWEKYSSNGIRAVDQYYSWEAHVNTYMEELERVSSGEDAVLDQEKNSVNIGRRLSKAKVFFITDLDGTLIDDEQDNDGLDNMKNWIESNRGHMVFGVATGRNKVLTAQALEDFQLPSPDILISSAGSELYYTDEFIPDQGWENHISYRWNRQKLQSVLKGFPKIELQESDAQFNFKLSYYVDDSFNSDDLANLYKRLDDNHLKANVLLTDNTFLDLLPARASKGNAIKYLSYKWNIGLGQFMTAGNGGNDIDMLKGKTKGIVVGNYSAELESLRKSKSIFFAQQPLANGILEGIAYWSQKAFKL